MVIYVVRRKKKKHWDKIFERYITKKRLLSKYIKNSNQSKEMTAIPIENVQKTNKHFTEQ